MSTRPVDPTETAVSLQDSYKDVTEWYASRTTVNDASSFRVLAVSLLVLVSNNHHGDLHIGSHADSRRQPWVVLGFFAFIKFNPNVSASAPA